VPGPGPVLPTAFGIRDLFPHIEYNGRPVSCHASKCSPEQCTHLPLPDGLARGDRTPTVTVPGSALGKNGPLHTALERECGYKLYHKVRPSSARNPNQQVTLTCQRAGKSPDGGHTNKARAAHLQVRISARPPPPPGRPLGRVTPERGHCAAAASFCAPEPLRA